MHIHEVRCYLCERHLNYASPYEDYYLHLSATQRHSDGAVFSVMIYPPIDRDKHFCGVKCLFLWSAKQIGSTSFDRHVNSV